MHANQSHRGCPLIYPAINETSYDSPYVYGDDSSGSGFGDGYIGRDGNGSGDSDNYVGDGGHSANSLFSPAMFLAVVGDDLRSSVISAQLFERRK